MTYRNNDAMISVTDATLRLIGPQLVITVDGSVSGVNLDQILGANKNRFVCHDVAYVASARVKSRKGGLYHRNVFLVRRGEALVWATYGACEAMATRGF